MRYENNIAQLLTIHEIHHEADFLDYARGREILGKYPDAKLIEVRTQNEIPELIGFAGQVEYWLQIQGL